MLVGEVPGDREDREGRPFVGPDGRELDNALQDAGIDRASAYVTNVVKHFKFQERGKRRSTNASTPAIKACRPWFGAELDVIGPEAIIILGATAGKACSATPSGSASSAAGRSRATSHPSRWQRSTLGDHARA